MARACISFLPFVSACALLVSGCAVQATRQAPAQLAAPAIATEAPGLRLRRLARPLLMANADRCKARLWDLGFYAQRDRSPSAPGPDEPEGYRVARLDPGGPADRAGLKLNDRIVAVNGAAWTSPAFVAAFTGANQAEPAARQLALQVTRDPAALTVTLAGDSACAIPVFLRGSRQINASANATSVFINARLEQVLAADDQLSAVIAHELAHVILAHVPATKAGGPKGPARRQAELDADALNVRLLLRAGLDPEGAVRAIGTLGQYRGPLGKLFGITGPYLRTADRQQFLRDQIAAARADNGVSR